MEEKKKGEQKKEKKKREKELTFPHDPHVLTSPWISVPQEGQAL